ncbi:hypothetical protein [Salinigranum sp.]|uniref:hypothetical protein n=1 Tax=Salinigranum sp. TaxID=1966351 RepID=UPI003565BA30
MRRRDTGVARRRLLEGGTLLAAGVGTGCLGRTVGGNVDTGTAMDGERRTDSTRTEAEPTPAAGDLPEVVGVTVTDFVQYPLSGTHPHVHNRADTRYVVVRVAQGQREPREIREDLTLTLGGPTAPRASRQPVPWQHESVDVAFAVSKARRVDEGQVRYRGTVLHTLGPAALDRLNEPPAFVVSDVGVSPAELDAGERATATVRLTVTNEGAGAGTFGVSLTGNYVSGAETVTARFDAGERRDVVSVVGVVGRGEAATVGVDWGVDSRRVTIPVVGRTTTATSAETATETNETG